MLVLNGYENSSVVGVGRFRPVFYVMCYVMQDSRGCCRRSNDTLCGCRHKHGRATAILIALEHPPWAKSKSLALSLTSWTRLHM